MPGHRVLPGVGFPGVPTENLTFYSQEYAMPGPSPSQLCTAAADAVDAFRLSLLALNAANPITSDEVDAASVAKGTAINALQTFASEAEQFAAQNVNIGGFTMNGPVAARRLVDQFNAGSLGTVEIELIVAKLEQLAAGYTAGQ